MDRPRWFHQALAGLLGVLALCGAVVWPAQGQAEGSYRDRTAAALAQLDLTTHSLAQGDAAGARAAIDRMGKEVADLAATATRFREVANREFERCGSRVQEFDRRIGKILTEQERLQDNVRELGATLASTDERARLSSVQLNDINARLSAANAALQERVSQLRELEQWWWVPGYGAYLGIRTLANHDIEEARSLSNSLNDERHRLHDALQVHAAAARLSSELAAQIRSNTATSAQLAGMKDQAVRDMQQLRDTARFLTEAEAFWLKATTLLQVNIQGAGTDMKLLMGLLDTELTLTDFDKEFTPEARTMREALVAFASSVDDRSSFLLGTSTDYCGGPPREAMAAKVSVPCNVSQITRYFEITDPVTCSFRYKNPPGCHPPARIVNLGLAAPDAGRARGAWTRAPGENWVGRGGTSPCEIAGAVYYGTLAGPDQCEAACQGDPGCLAWSYNIRNGFMPGSIGQCWGAPQEVELNKRSWSGFESGGLSPGHP